MSLSEVSGSGDTDRSLTLTAAHQITSWLHNFSLFLYSAVSTVTAISFKPKATRKRLKKEILRDDFKKRKIFHLASLAPSEHYTSGSSISSRQTTATHSHSVCSEVKETETRFSRGQESQWVRTTGQTSVRCLPLVPYLRCGRLLSVGAISGCTHLL
jgi:hypothetical protein